MRPLDERICRAVHPYEWYLQPDPGKPPMVDKPRTSRRAVACPECQRAAVEVADWLLGTVSLTTCVADTMDRTAASVAPNNLNDRLFSLVVAESVVIALSREARP